MNARHALPLAALVLGACTVGPDFKRPDVDLPENFGIVQPAAAPPQRWWSLFGDPILDKLVDEALAANRDLRAAAERIEASRAQLRIANASLWPDAGVEANASRSRASALGSFPLPPEAILTNDYRVVARLSWELDFWGKYRRASEAARAELLATEAGRDAVRNSLVADVVRAYYGLRAIDRRLETVVRTLEGRREALGLQKLRYDAGAVSELEYRQVESDLRTAEALLPLTRQLQTQQEGALALLLGRSPREVYSATVERGTAAVITSVEVPAGLPSDLLLRRPDLRQAEAQLHAANARIGVARAAYFPSISLTGDYGRESQSLGNLWTGPARTWSIGAGLLQPVFAGGQIRGGIELADARTREAAELYQKAVANAFREVRDALAAQANLRAAAASQLDRERALERSLELARLRYDKGAIGLFEVLETERQLLAARLDAIDAERARAASIADLYLALGL